MSFLDLREPVSAWTHALGVVLSLLALLRLWRRSRGNLAKRICFLIFGLSLLICYTASTLFHSVRGPQERIAAFARFDLIGIYTLIAGTYTPMAWVLLRGRWRWGTLATAWLVAATAAALIARGVLVPPAVSTGLFLAAGWGVIACSFELIKVVPLRALRPVVVGGLLYTTGAVINLTRWPILWPGAFESHELFHLFVIAGSATHFQFMLAVVAPFTPTAIDVVHRAPHRSGAFLPGATRPFDTKEPRPGA